VNSKIFLASISLISSFSWSANLLSNPDFETDLEGWNHQVQGDADIELSVSTTDPQNGINSLNINVKTISTDNWHAQLNVPTEWTAEAGKEYHLSFWAKADNNQSIHIAAQDGAPNFAYRKGFDHALTDQWKLIDVYYTSDVDGLEALRFNIFVGSFTGNYEFDNFSLEVIDGSTPTTISPQEEASMKSASYRNLFKELGKSQAEVDAKIDDSFQQLFFGNSNESIYEEVGEDMAFIKSIDSDDIRSEGMSYGMMIAVQLNKKEVFDRLWKFAYTYSLHHDGDREGYFSWQLKTSAPYDMIDPNPAPDGEEYFAMALFFAKNRWGNGEGVFNYESEANKILSAMLHKAPNLTQVPMINPEHKQIVFTTDNTADAFTDPSYHLPSFYELWAIWAKEDNTTWAEMADTSRAFFRRNSHPSTGLSTDYANFDGTPKPTSFNGNSHFFAYDAHRTVQNIAMDYAWTKKDPTQVEIVDKYLTFLNSKTPYAAVYTQAGEAQVSYGSASLTAMNAVGALASTKPIAWGFVDALWEMPMPTGEYRYYNGLLTMLALLQVAGEYKIWGLEEVSPIEPQSSVAPFKIWESNNEFYIDLNNGKYDLSLYDVKGKVLFSQKAINGQVKFHTISTIDHNSVYLHIKNENGQSWVRVLKNS
jgi:oligosaccharide reducing-end xylanase